MLAPTDDQPTDRRSLQDGAYVEVGAGKDGQALELAEPFPVRVVLTDLTDLTDL